MEPIKHLRAMIERVAPTDARILITGDNGTGKEVVARQIYQLSHRSQMPFVEVNCAAIPSKLIESELLDTKKARLHRLSETGWENLNKRIRVLSF